MSFRALTDIIDGMDAAAHDVIAVTDTAAGKIGTLARREGRSEAILRVRVTAGGCSGFRYELAYADAPVDGDVVIDAAGGVRVVIDPISAPILRGSTLDLDQSLIGGGLRIRNPQAVHECACGESFSVAPA
jgi:iron-sulfur cluster insertion protein